MTLKIVTTAPSGTPRGAHKHRDALFAVTSLSLVSLAVACGAIDSPRSESVDGNLPGSSGAVDGGSKGPVGTCTAAPACDKGDTRIPNKGACSQDQARCYDRKVCGQTI